DAVPEAEQLDDVILAYLEGVEAGESPDRAAWLARYPHLADELAAFFADQDQFSSLIPPISPDPPRPSSPPPPNTLAHPPPAPARPRRAGPGGAACRRPRYRRLRVDRGGRLRRHGGRLQGAAAVAGTAGRPEDDPVRQPGAARGRGPLPPGGRGRGLARSPQH